MCTHTQEVMSVSQFACAHTPIPVDNTLFCLICHTNYKAHNSIVH